MPPNPPSSRSRHATSAQSDRPEGNRRRRGSRGRRSSRRDRRRHCQPAQDEAVVEAEENDTDAPVLTRLEALPLSLFHQIMAFAVGFARKLPHQQRTPAERDLEEIALVSKAVRVHATEIEGQLALGKLLLVINTGSRKEMLEHRRALLYRRVYVREIEIDVFPPSNQRVDHAQDWLRGVLGELASMVSLAPQLEILNLSTCCGDVSGIVAAAAKNCLHLQALVLPTDRLDDHRGRTVDVVDMQPLMDALFTGLPNWHRRSGGLRQLRLPSRPAADRFSTSMDFVQRVIAFCPKIELLDAAVPQWSGDDSVNEWLIDRTVWERFCQRCTSLRAFDWVTIPWATEFFEIFATYPKRQLTDLTLKTTMQWDWDAYFDHVGTTDAAAMRVRGFGATANRVHRVLKACPSLKRVVIITNSRVSNDDATLDAMVGLEEYDGRQAPLPYKDHNAMNPNLFGDNFCRAVARHCPLLEEFRIEEDYQSLAAAMKRVRSIERFQDAALESLAQLQHLAVVDVKAVNVSGKGLFRFVSSVASEAHGTRCYKFALGEARGKLAKSFYTAVLDFLQCMLQAKSELLIPSKRIYVCVTNGNTSVTDERWSESYLARLKGAIRALRRKYPTLTFRVETDGLTNKSFSTIYGFGFYTESATQPPDSRWIDLPEEALEEDVFVLEEVLDEYAEEGEDEDEYEDSDEDEGFDGDDREWIDEDDDVFDSDEDDDDDDDDGYGGGRYNDGRRRQISFFNGIDLPDLQTLAIRDHTGDEEDDEDNDGDHTFDDQDGYDY